VESGMGRCYLDTLSGTGGHEAVDCIAEVLDEFMNRVTDCLENLGCPELESDNPDYAEACYDSTSLEILNDLGIEGDENTDVSVIALWYCDGLSSDAQSVLRAMDACPDPN
jgi:hypothetical protein